MDRSDKMSSSPPPFEDDLYEASPEPIRRRTINQRTSSSPPASSSDKENRSIRPQDKGKGRTPMESLPSRTTTPAGQVKRKRATENDALDRNHDRHQRRRTTEIHEDQDDANGSEADAYDPDQDIEERRAVRNVYRELNRNLNENRAEYLAADSNGLRDILQATNNLSRKVKQTSDATIDSRLLVTTADLSYKRTLALISGDTSQGVDVDEFISKCKAYMRRGGVPDIQPSQAPTSTQQRRRRGNVDLDEDAEDDGDLYNWEYLGRHACLPFNSRPSVPGFILGPLSVEKRARKIVVRKAALKPSAQESRPEVLKSGDISRDENENLTTLCTQILARLRKVSSDLQAAVDAEAEENMTDDEVQDLMTRYHVSPDGGVAYFPFVVNPQSFGQTIENMFYVSFLIRDGKMAVREGNDAMPYLILCR